ncbi:MAG TPA: DUF2958 domain-containing protein [Arthrobacter sp.]
MSANTVHQPAGIPIGGQFAPTAHSDEVAPLTAGGIRPEETQRECRGHDFYPPASEMATWPQLYATDNNGPIGEKPIQAHYFQGGMDWYIAEYDPAGNEAFGYADLGMGGGEWGYIPLGDVEELRGQMGLPIERDLDFTPGTPANECIDRYKAEAAKKKAADEAAAGELAALLGSEDGEDDERYDIEWPDDSDPMSPEDRAQYDTHHRFSYAYGTSVLGCKGFEDRDTVERFAGFAAKAYQDSGWNGMMDIHGVVDDWHAQEFPNG